MAKIYPKISELRELRHALSNLRLTELMVGKVRGLIRPSFGRALAYIDWSGQEYGIAAALSGDAAMMADYLSGDPYLTFAKHLGAVPQDATKHTHPEIRESFKVALGLGAMYGAGPATIATMISKTPAESNLLLEQHKCKYPRFWRWRDAAVDFAMMTNRLYTVFGWTIHVESGINPRSLANFPMQANAAEMLRLACIYVTEAGISLCAPVHDALLIEGPAEQIDDLITQTRRLMAQASRDVLDGFELRTSVEKIVHPDRYRDEKRGGPMWDRVLRLLSEM